MSAERDRLVEQIKALGLQPGIPIDELPPHVQELLKEYLKSTGQGVGSASGSVGVDPGLVDQLWTNIGQQITDDAVKASTKTAKADGTITPNEQAAIDKSKETGTVASAAPDVPRWILESFQHEPTPAEKSRIENDWNQIFGTKYTWDQLITLPQFNDPTETVQKVVQAAQLDIEPQVEYSVTLPGNRSFKVSEDQQKTQFGQYGYSTKDIVKAVRFADTFGLKNEKGDPAWQPLAALMKAKGLDLNGTPKGDNTPVGPSTGAGPLGPMGPPTDVYLPSHATGPGMKKNKDGTWQPGAPHRKVIGDYQEGPAFGSPDLSIAMLANGYSNALKQYGDPSMAFVATLDPALAQRLMASGGDSTKVSEDDVHLMDEYMTSGSWDPSKLHEMGYAGGTGIPAFMNRLLDRANAAKGAIRVMPDPATIKQSVIDFWRSMFRADPSEATVNQMAGELLAQAKGAPEGQNVDITARLRQMAEGTSTYKTLYGNMQPGQTPADYQQQFVAASQDMLGNEAPDNGSVLSGMRTGQYQTTVGSTAGSSRAWQNSRFLGRLAQAAQMVNSST